MGLVDRDKIDLIGRNDPRTSWFPKSWDKSAFPIMHQPGTEQDNITGTAFVMYYQGVPYIVTAKHVLETENPAIHFLLKNGQGRSFGTSYFNALGLDWIKHDTVDVAAIPFHMALQAIKPLHIFFIKEEWWNLELNIKAGNFVKHLGYPDKDTTPFPDGSSSMVGIGMVGKVLSVTSNEIRLRTSAHLGASGGPVFVKSTTGPCLIGVASESDVLANKSLTEGEYLGKTTVVPIKYVKELLDSDKMQKQYLNRSITEDMF